MPCARAGLPSGPANQVADSSIQMIVGGVVAATPYSMRYGAPSPLCASGELPSASVRMDCTGSISRENSAPLVSACGGIPEKTEAAWSLQAISSVAMSHTKAAWPSRARMVDACGGANVTVASFRDTAEDDSRSTGRPHSAADPLTSRKPLHKTARNSAGRAGIDPCRPRRDLWPSWRELCEREDDTKHAVPKRDESVKIGLSMSDDYHSDRPQDGIIVDADFVDTGPADANSLDAGST